MATRDNTTVKAMLMRPVLPRWSVAPEVGLGEGVVGDGVDGSGGIGPPTKPQSPNP